MMKQMMNNLIDRYLHPDQIVFGNLFNPSIKCAHSYQMSKSDQKNQQSDEIVVYHKQMSQIKINSMLNMIQGNNQPLFKSGLSASNLQRSHLANSSHANESSDYSDYDDDQQSYNEEMYLMQKDYDNLLEDSYDEQQNPIMAFGQSIGTLPSLKNYAKDFNYNIKPSQNKNIRNNSPAFASQSNPNPNMSRQKQGLGQILRQKQGLGQILRKGAQNKQKTNQILVNKTKFGQSGRKNDKKPQQNENQGQQNQSDQDWETQSQQQVETEHNKQKAQF